MDIKQLRYFISVAELLSFSRAAENLYVSQPALSQRIKDLENEFGTPLFERNYHTVNLTPVGNALYGPIKEIVNRFDDLPKHVEMCMRTDRRRIPYRILISSPPSEEEGFRYIMARALREAAREYPYIDIELKMADGSVYMPEVPKLGFDLLIGVHHTADPAQKLHTEVLYKDRLYLVTAKEMYRPGPGMENSLPKNAVVYMLDTNIGMQIQMMQIFNDMGVEPKIRYLSDESNSMIRLYSGGGFILRPGLTLRGTDVSRLTLIAPNTNRADFYYLASYEKDRINHFTPAFISILRACFVREAAANVSDPTPQAPPY